MNPIEFYELSKTTVFLYKKYPSERGFHIVKTFFSLIFYQYLLIKKKLKTDPGTVAGVTC